MRERRRQQELAACRSPLSREDFVEQLSGAEVPPEVASFLWDEVQPYYFKPLQPDPEDRLMGEFKVDGDDLSDIAVKFETTFSRKYIGEWSGPEDPTLTEFAQSLLSSTELK